MMEFRSPVYTEKNDINCEINHPVYGWIPFTASQNDSEKLGRDLYADIVSKGAIAEYIAPPLVIAVPQTVTRFQALAALHGAGLLTQVQTIINDPATDMLVKLALDNAQTFERNSPTIAALALQLGLTDADIDQLFITASTIKA